nr:MAG TPA: hypothetical protein [Caudoviricetes sp.]
MGKDKSLIYEFEIQLSHYNPPSESILKYYYNV